MRRCPIRVITSTLFALAAVAIMPTAVFAQPQTPSGELLRFNQTCDASAVVMTRDGGLLVGDDANNILRTYGPSGGDPTGEIDVYKHTAVNLTRARPYSEIAGAARVGNRIYWIASHTRDMEGWRHGSRHRLFALESVQTADGETSAPVGHSYDKLHKDLAAAPTLKSVRLEKAIMPLHRKLPHLAPDKAGIDIEGLAATKDDKGLLIALRNPKWRNRAIVIPMSNPDRVLARAESAVFGDPILLDLGGLGIVSIELAPKEGVYYIVAASQGANVGHKLYRWSGESADAPVLLRDLDIEGLRPKAMAVALDGERFALLSDDGDLLVQVDEKDCRRKREADGSCTCSFVTNPAKKSFRGLWIDIPTAPTTKTPAGRSGGAE